MNNFKPYTYSEQVGTPGHCYAAQIFDGDGNSIAVMDTTDDQSIATERARKLTEAYNACKGRPEIVGELVGVIGEVKTILIKCGGFADTKRGIVLLEQALKKAGIDNERSGLDGI